MTMPPPLPLLPLLPLLLLLLPLTRSRLRDRMRLANLPRVAEQMHLPARPRRRRCQAGRMLRPVPRALVGPR